MADSVEVKGKNAERRRPTSLPLSVYLVTVVFLLLGAGYFVFAFRSNQNRIANLYLAKAKALMRQDQFGEATRALEKARLADPQSLQIQTEQLKAEIFQITKRADSLDRILNLPELDQAETDCKHLLSEDPGSAELTALLGIVYAHKDQPTLAIETYKKAMEMNPQYANVRNYWGRSTFQWWFPERRAEATQKFKEAQQLDETYQAPGINLALIQYSDEDFRAAINILRETEKLGKNNELLYTLWGAALDESGKKLTDKVEAYKTFSEALDKYRIAEAINPNLSIIHANKAEALADLERFDDSIDEYEKAIKLEPGLAQARIDLATKVLLKRRNPARKDLEQALNCFNEAIRVTQETIEQYKYRKARTSDVRAQLVLENRMNTQLKQIADLQKQVHDIETELAGSDPTGKNVKNK